MVILARAAGLPARLAVGYANGTYNMNSKRFIVTQADAHSWVEVYFPGIGWVPFEPTAGLPAINRSVQPTQEATPPVITTTVPPSGSAFGNLAKYIGYAIMILTVASGLIWAIFDGIRLKRLKPQLAVREVYRRMRRYGELLGASMEGGETPYEFAVLLTRCITEITRQGFAATKGLTTADETQSLIRKIVRHSYRPMDTKSEPASRIIDQWKSLRWRLRLLWVLRIWESALHQHREGFTSQAKNRDPLAE
jgi:hypothetical protein